MIIVAYVMKKVGYKNQSIFFIKCLKSSHQAPSSGFSGFHLYFFNFSTDSSFSPSPIHVLSHFIVAFITVSSTLSILFSLLLAPKSNHCLGSQITSSSYCTFYTLTPVPQTPISLPIQTRFHASCGLNEPIHP